MEIIFKCADCGREIKKFSINGAICNCKGGIPRTISRINSEYFNESKETKSMIPKDEILIKDDDDEEQPAPIVEIDIFERLRRIKR